MFFCIFWKLNYVISPETEETHVINLQVKPFTVIKKTYKQFCPFSESMVTSSNGGGMTLAFLSIKGHNKNTIFFGTKNNSNKLPRTIFGAFQNRLIWQIHVLLLLRNIPVFPVHSGSFTTSALLSELVYMAQCPYVCTSVRL